MRLQNEVFFSLAYTQVYANTERPLSDERNKTMAEREGFEPPIPFQVWPLSRRLVSTAHAPLRVKSQSALEAEFCFRLHSSSRSVLCYSLPGLLARKKSRNKAEHCASRTPPTTSIL